MANIPTSKSKIIDFTEKHQYLVSGKQIKDAIINKEGKLRSNMEKLLDQLKDIPQDQEDMAIMIMALHKPNSTDARILLAKGLAEGAARIHDDIEALAAVARNIHADVAYVLTEKDIVYYGL